MMPRDTSVLDGSSVNRRTAQRVWRFARPYRGTITVFVTAIIVAAILALVPPLVVRAILDTAIPQADRRLIIVLAMLAVVAALADAGLQILQRWC